MTIAISNRAFWDSIDEAWSAAAIPADQLASVSAARAALCARSDAEDARYAAAVTVGKGEDAFLAALRTILDTYTQDQLAAWDEHCAQALYALDREDVHEALDGSDDGFLYARGFVLIVGQTYFDLVLKQPDVYGVDAECESVTYIACHLSDKKFGEWPKASVSRETCSNREGWE